MKNSLQIFKKLSKTKAICLCVQCGSEYICGYRDAIKSKTGDQCKACNTQISSLKDLTKESLEKIFRYDPHTGNLYYLNKSYSGDKDKIAGYKHDGYLAVSIGRKEYLVHRIIWLMQTGKWPIEVDHIDHNRSNNKWENLREVRPQEQQRNMKKRRNNTSGVQGIRILPSGKFCAYIMVNRVQISLGSYISLDDAIKARKDAEVFYGFHKNHGN